MAERMTAALHHRVTCKGTLQSSLKLLEDYLQKDTATQLEAVLARNIGVVTKAWEDFRVAHEEYVQLKKPEGDEVITELSLYQDMFTQVQDMEDKATELSVNLKSPDTTFLLETARDRVEVQKKWINQQLDSVEVKLTDTVTAHSKAGLQEFRNGVKETELAVSDKLMNLYEERMKVEPSDMRSNVKEERDRYNLTVQTKIREIVSLITDKMANLVTGETVVHGVASTGATVHSGSVGGGQYYYERTPLPKFDGKKRNYPTFCRDWQSCVGTRFDATYQLREIRKRVPSEVEPDIKNLKTMSEVWRILDNEYGQPMEISSDAVRSLREFQFSNKSRTDHQKFTELFGRYNEVKADLEEIGMVHNLSHEPTINEIVRKLPSRTSKTEYVKMRSDLLSEDHTELEIFDKFMLKERKR